MAAPIHGKAWNTVMKVKTSLHYLFLPDWNHPTPRGTYLMACVIYSTLFEESTEGLTYYSKVTEDDAVYFQQIASDVVLDNLELWNIVP